MRASLWPRSSPARLPRLGAMKRYRTREHDGLASAWAAFARDCGEALPRDAALAIAAPIEGEILTFMNSDWRIARATLAAELGLEQAGPAQRFRRGR